MIRETQQRVRPSWDAFLGSLGASERLLAEQFAAAFADLSTHLAEAQKTNRPPGDDRKPIEEITLGAIT